MTNPELFGYRDILLALRDTDLSPDSHVLAFGPPKAPPNLRGGVSALLAAVRASCKGLLTPTFTFQTMVFPASGPADNGIDYAVASAHSPDAEIFRPKMKSAPGLGPLAEAVRRSEGAFRSSHPILSFAGLDARHLLESQSLAEPLAPVDELARAGGDVLLLGVDQTVNTALHLAEARAGRRQFLRWALTTGGVVECPAFPGCPYGLNAIEGKLQSVEQTILVGSFRISRIPLRDLMHIATGWIREDPTALLCGSSDCPLCQAVRKNLAGKK